MCTVSTFATKTAFIVTMNRDERRSRLEGPLAAGNTVCYPTDAQAGGTWCGINNRGLILCLLNRYDAPVSTDASILSRGEIIPKALSCGTVQEASAFISQLDFARYNGFRLQVLSPTECVQHDWDREVHTSVVHKEPGNVFASSSSLRPTLIPKEREKRYRAWQQTTAEDQSVGEIASIHVEDTKVAPSESMFMVRRDTHTKSICQLAVHDAKVSFHYWPAQTGLNKQRVESWSSELQVVNGPGIKPAKTG